MKHIKFLILLIFACSLQIMAQDSNQDTLKSVLSDYSMKMKAGDLLGAVDCLTGLLRSDIQFSEERKLGLNNNLGVLHKDLGQYDIALKYYDAAETICLNNNFSNNYFLINIYGNKGNIYSIKGEFAKALEYTEKGIRSVKTNNTPELSKQQTYASLYLNEGIVYAQMNDFNHALSSFNKSILIKNKFNFPGKSIIYLNIANIYAKMKNNLLAEKYYKLSLNQVDSENKYFSTLKVNILIEYGHFLLTINEDERAQAIIDEALKNNIEFSGERNQLTANCYQLMGDCYKIANSFQKALTYYQKALISGSIDFNQTAFDANPTINAIFPNLWQLRALRRKAEVLVSLAGDVHLNLETKTKYLTLSLNTINLAIEMTNSLRLEYKTEETRLDFTGKQKDIYVLGIETALKQFTLTGNKTYLKSAYNTSQQYKANELKYEIEKNRSFANIQVPDSLRLQEIKYKNNIAGYNMLINGEYSIVNPDTAKIAYWKDQIFDLNRSLEKTIEKIEIKYPLFLDKFKKGSIIPTETIQANLKPDESIVDYVISEKDEFGNRKIFEFVITKNDLICHSQLIDSIMSSQFSNLKAKLINQFNEKTNIESYNQLNLLLYNAYKELILPIKDHFSGNKLIIIPDEEISYFPFDALLTSWNKKTMVNYAELNYLIFDYTISYGYSTNTLWTKRIEKLDNTKVIGFAPDYSEGITANGIMFNKLKTNTNEIENILTIFDGEIFKGDEASIVQFKSHLNNGSILHLAMHAEVNNIHEGSSSLLFTPNQINNYRLYNYEIGQMSINSPMVVLSACNTGNGKIYSGEGAMSIARNFVLAGVPSVIETLWPVEDLSGSKIMISYYRHLSEGKEKNNALRLAKLDYILTTSPSFVNPRFWAAYTLLGDTSPLKQIWWKEKTIIICAIIILFLLVLFITYYRWRSLRIKRALFL